MMILLNISVRGYGVYSIDLRGQGNSEGKRGHINNFKKLLNDSEEMFINIGKKNSSLHDYYSFNTYSFFEKMFHSTS